MKTADQLRFDFGDRKQYLDAVLMGRNTGAGDWVVARWNNQFWLSIRTPDPAGATDYTDVEKLSVDDVKYLIKERHVYTAASAHDAWKLIEENV